MSKKNTRERYFIAATVAIVPGITAEKIRECLRETEGMRLSESTLGSILTALENEGMIRTRWGGNKHGTWRKCWIAKEE